MYVQVTTEYMPQVMASYHTIRILRYQTLVQAIRSSLLWPFHWLYSKLEYFLIWDQLEVNLTDS